jgi:hypothetical protein
MKKALKPSTNFSNRKIPPGAFAQVEGMIDKPYSDFICFRLDELQSINKPRGYGLDKINNITQFLQD